MLLMLAIKLSVAQDLWFTRNGNIKFHAGTSLEDIDATNNDVASLFNPKTGEFAFTVLIKSFHFRRALMEEHFNTVYMESSTYPKATFSGTVNDISKLNITKDGSYSVEVSGDITIHGVTKKITIPGIIEVKSGKPQANAKFTVLVADYNIKVPGIVADKISKEVAIEVSCLYEKK